MASIRDRIVDDVVSKINTGTPPAGVPTAKRSYTFQLSGDSIVVFPVKDEADRIGGRVTGGPVQRRTLTLAVECRAQGTASLRPDQVVDVLAQWVEQKLGGQSKGVNDGALYHVMLVGPTVFALEQADHSYCLARVEVVVEYQSRVDDPATWA